jgi:hypothetical protein
MLDCGDPMENNGVDMEEFLMKEHEQSYEQLRNMDHMLTTYFWLYISLVVVVTSIIGIIMGLDVSRPNLLIFISISSLILLIVGLAMLQISLHIKDRQNLLAAYIQEMVFYFMGKGLKPVGGGPRNKEAARILDFKYIFDHSHKDDWHMRRREHIQGYGSPDEAGDSWTTGYSLANKMMFFLVLILSGLVAFAVASLASAVIWGNSGDLETSQRTGQYLYFGIVLGMELFVVSWIFFRYVLKNRMKAKKEFADEAFRRKRKAWFSAQQNPKKVEELIESTISWKKQARAKE